MVMFFVADIEYFPKVRLFLSNNEFWSEAYCG